MKVGFYNLNHEKGFTLKIIINKLIAWFCADFKDKFNGKWRDVPSHCEFVYCDNSVNYMFSADLFRNEVRIKPFKPKSESQWTLIGVECGDFADFIEATLGCKYDFTGLLYFATGINWQISHRWFCSELVTALLQNAGCDCVSGLTPHKVTPKDLYKKLKGA